MQYLGGDCSKVITGDEILVNNFFAFFFFCAVSVESVAVGPAVGIPARRDRA